MRGNIFSHSKTHLFSEKELKQKIKKEKLLLKKKQKQLEKKYKEEQKKRKIIEKIIKRDLKKQSKEQNTHAKHQIISKQKIHTPKPKIPKEHTKQKTLLTHQENPKEKIHPPKNKKSFNLPTINELNKHLYKLSEKYDKGIIKSKKLHRELHFLGLKDTGFEEIKNEKPNKRKARIKKINKIHDKLIKILEENKKTEQEIEKIHNFLKKTR